MRNLTQDGHNQGIFFQTLSTFFQFLKKGKGDISPPLPPLVTRLHNTSYKYIPLNK